MNMSTWAIRNPVPSLALFLVVCVIGLVSFFRLPVTELPNVDIPVVTVAIAQPGAAPSEIVSQIVKPVEDAISDIIGVDRLNATASDGSANITVRFTLGTDIDRALIDVKDAIAGVRSELPESISEPLIKRRDVAGAAILTYAVSDPTRSVEDLSYFVDEVVARELQSARGVGKVSRIGGADRAILVELDPDRLLSLGLNASEVNSQLRRINVDLGGGSGDLAGQEYSIRTLGSARTLEEFADTPLTRPSGHTVSLNELGAVSDGAMKPTSFALLDGQPIVAFSVFRATGASDLEAAERAKKRLATLIEQYPNAHFSQIRDATVYTDGNYASAMESLYEGAVLAIIVVFVFLRNWRATIITAIALPLSIIPTFFVMQWLGFSLNTVSLLGITLVTGILVDDAIVEIENIVRHINMGKPAYEASEEAASEIGLTVIAISFTIVAVFAPVSFMGGVAGQYFKQFGLTVAVAVLFSLLVARLLTPMLSAYFLKNPPSSEESKDGRTMQVYMQILRWTLKHRTITLLLGLGIFAASIYSATLLPTEFVPDSDRGRVLLSVELPPGSKLVDTRKVTKEISGIIGKIAEVRSVFVEGGSGNDTQANVYVNFGQKNERDRSLKELISQLRTTLADVPDVKLTVLNDGGGRDLSIRVLGDSEGGTNIAAKQLASQINELPLLTNAEVVAAFPRPELRIKPRPELSAELGITAATLANTIRIATIGDSEANVAKYSAGERQIPIIVRLGVEVRNDLSKIGGIRIPRTSGKPIPLSVVADLSLSTGPSLIERYDRQYRTKVEADLVPGALLGPASKAMSALPILKNMPEGTSIQRGGNAELMADVFTSFGLAMGTGILLVYVVLVLLFSSFITPITILLSLPLAIGGAIFALYLNGSAIGLSVIIGFLMLMGIVTKNAIMLVEFALEAMKLGVHKNQAMLDAGHKRARPIIMTTIAMTAGMLPTALAFDLGGEFRAPMAVAVIGGLLLSTLLSLLFVPSLFSAIEGIRVRMKSLLVRVFGTNQPKTA